MRSVRGSHVTVRGPRTDRTRAHEPNADRTQSDPTVRGPGAVRVGRAEPRAGRAKPRAGRAEPRAVF